MLLPTVDAAPPIDEIAAQLGAEDELLVICDAADDPVAVAAEANELPTGVRLVVAGDPERCSGKANAIAVGMETARHERLVWTDDDYHHPGDWLATLQADYERNGPSTELPVFRGRDPLAVLLEPSYLCNGTLGVFTNETAWGGAVIFERSDLERPDGRGSGSDRPAGRSLDSTSHEFGVQQRALSSETDAEASLRRGLRRTISDDGLLTQYLDVTSVHRIREVPVGGSTRTTLERHVRFYQIVRYFEPTALVGMALASLVAVVAIVVAPLLALFLGTLTVGAVYAWFGVRRWTFLLAYPALLVQVPLTGYALARRTFVWGSRRYRWRSTFDVDVVEES